MTMQFKKATKQKAHLRLALVGPSGGGKTYTALAIATNLGSKVAVIDTEHGSASKYAHKFGFDVLELDSFGPQQYIDALEAAGKAGYEVVIIDSLSHAWMGKGGALEQVDNAARRSASKNSYTAWRDVTPQHNAMVEAIIRAPMHVIATMRSKTEYVIEKDEKGKNIPRKIGIQPVQRDGLEYEFDVVADMDLENNDLIVGKTRCEHLHGKVFRKAGKDVATILTQWLTDGAEPAPTGLEKALVASVDAAWPRWLSTTQAALREAAAKGELLETWLDVDAEIKKLCPPSDYVAQVVATKDELKATNAA